MEEESHLKSPERESHGNLMSRVLSDPKGWVQNLGSLYSFKELR